jgi:hypothetical protein
MEPSLLAALLFEARDKVRMNVLNTLAVVLEHLEARHWL